MARFVNPGRSLQNIDRVVEQWKERCLLADGSLLFDDRAVWSLANLQDFRERFLTGAIYGTGENFEEKLEKQLADASDDVRLLAAELLVVHFLFAYVAIGAEAKIKIVRDAAGDAWQDDAPGWELVEAAMHEGIGNPGSGYNVRRDIQVSYLLDFTIRWKALPAEEQRAKRDDAGRVGCPLSCGAMKTFRLDPVAGDQATAVVKAVDKLLSEGRRVAVTVAEEQELLSPQQAARRLGFSRQHVRRLIDYGELEARQLPGSSSWKIPLWSVLALGAMGVPAE